jgi:hypothetical protein
VRIKTSTDFIAPISLLALLGLVIFCLSVLTVLWHVPKKIDGLGFILVNGAINQVQSTHSGTVMEWLVEEGDHVNAGDPIAKVALVADPKIMDVVRAVSAGEIAEILAYPGTVVEKNQALVLLTAIQEAGSSLEVMAFVSSLSGKKITANMVAEIRPTIFNPHREGFLLGHVKRVGKLPVSKSALGSLIKIPELAKYIRSQIEAEPFLITIAVDSDASHESGYSWVGHGGFSLDSGILANVSVIVARPTLFELLFPTLYYRIFKNEHALTSTP